MADDSTATSLRLDRDSPAHLDANAFVLCSDAAHTILHATALLDAAANWHTEMSSLLDDDTVTLAHHAYPAAHADRCLTAAAQAMRRATTHLRWARTDISTLSEKTLPEWGPAITAESDVESIVAKATATLETLEGQNRRLSRTYARLLEQLEKTKEALLSKCPTP